MEPEIRAFLIRMMQTISLVLLWMLFNTLIGIKWGYLFINGKITTGHIIYFSLMIGTGIAIFIYLLKKWRNAPKYDQQNDEWIER